jgi:hypothetical protein
MIKIGAGVVLGLALGFAIGWGLWPVEYRNTTPDVLRQDYRDDYIVMTATAYGIDGDLARARERLALLSPADPAAPVVELAERLVDTGGSERNIVYLIYMAESLDALTPPLLDYQEQRK